MIVLSLKQVILPFCVITLFHMLTGTDTAPPPTATLLGGDDMCTNRLTKEKYSDGETWSESRCTYCTCVQGRRLCSQEECRMPDCPESEQVVLEGACCISCVPKPPVEPRGCLDKSTNTTYRHEESWKQDACTSCTCEDGESMCAVQDCAPTMCKNPVTTPGQCCPKCRRQECWDTENKQYRSESKCPCPVIIIAYE